MVSDKKIDKNKVVDCIKDAKYFFVILDCTLDVNNKEQITLIIVCCVNISSNIPRVEGFFLDF